MRGARMAGMTTGPADPPVTRAPWSGSAEPVALHIRGWHAAFWILLVLAGLFLAIDTRMGGRYRVVGYAVLVGLGLAYGLLVQGGDDLFGRRSLAYLGCAVLAVGVAGWVSPMLSMLLFIVYPQVWLLSGGLRAGTAISVAVTASTLTGYLAREGFTWKALSVGGPDLAASLMFSLLLGVWISKVIDQSLDRAELIQELRSTRAELASADHARGVMAERERMAREIHDTLAQGFTSVVMLAQAAAAGMARNPAQVAERLAAIEDVARENLTEARLLVAVFSPVGLDGSTLPDAVRRLVGRFTEQTGLPVDLEICDEAAVLTRDREVVLLRVLQESLTNVRRHAGARRVAVRLAVDADGGSAEVGDDGVGFEPQDAAGSGFGLAGMRGRVAEVGGELDVASAPGRGTRVRVQVPAIPSVIEARPSADPAGGPR